MNYTSVEVLKPIPGFDEPGKFSLHQYIGLKGEYSLKKDGITYSAKIMEAYPDFFRLISEPSFEVGGYANFKGVFYEIEATDGPFIRLKGCIENEPTTGTGWILASRTTIGTNAEYLAQEESKKPWKPKNGENYFNFLNTGEACTNLNINTDDDKMALELGNCFRTQNACQFFVDNYLKPAFEKYAQDYATLPAEVK